MKKFIWLLAPLFAFLIKLSIYVVSLSTLLSTPFFSKQKQQFISNWIPIFKILTLFQCFQLMVFLRWQIRYLWCPIEPAWHSDFMKTFRFFYIYLLLISHYLSIKTKNKLKLFSILSKQCSCRNFWILSYTLLLKFD